MTEPECPHTFTVDKLHDIICSKCGVSERKPYSDVSVFLELNDDDYVSEILGTNSDSDDGDLND